MAPQHSSSYGRFNGGSRCCSSASRLAAAAVLQQLLLSALTAAAVLGLSLLLVAVPRDLAVSGSTLFHAAPVTVVGAAAAAAVAADYSVVPLALNTDGHREQENDAAAAAMTTAAAVDVTHMMTAATSTTSGGDAMQRRIRRELQEEAVAMTGDDMVRQQQAEAADSVAMRAAWPSEGEEADPASGSTTAAAASSSTTSSASSSTSGGHDEVSAAADYIAANHISTRVTTREAMSSGVSTSTSSHARRRQMQRLLEASGQPHSASAIMAVAAGAKEAAADEDDGQHHDGGSTTAMWDGSRGKLLERPRHEAHGKLSLLREMSTMTSASAAVAGGIDSRRAGGGLRGRDLVSSSSSSLNTDADSAETFPNSRVPDAGVHWKNYTFREEEREVLFKIRSSFGRNGAKFMDRFLNADGDDICEHGGFTSWFICFVEEDGIHSSIIGLTLDPYILDPSHLTDFDAEATFVGQLPEEVSLLTNLNFIDMNLVTFTAPLPNVFSSMRNLSDISIVGGKGLTGTVPSFEGSKFASLLIAGNFPKLSFPSQFGCLGLKKLHRLSLVGLGLGSFPSEVFDCTYLRILGLVDSGLKGPLPDRFNTLTRLEQLILEDNFLTGPIPPTSTSSPKLYLLSLKNNSFSGPLPSFYVPPRGLDLEIHVDDNMGINGSIPKSLEQMAQDLYPNSLEITLNNTQISGPIPKLLLARNVYLTLPRNTGLCGAPQLNFSRCTSFPSPPPSPPHAAVFPPPDADQIARAQANGSASSSGASSPPPSSSSSSSSSTSLIIGLCSSFALLLVAALLLAVRSMHQRQQQQLQANRKELMSDMESSFAFSEKLEKYKSVDFDKQKSSLAEKLEQRKGLEGPVCFTFEELLAATDGFKHESLLGRGGFGHVYRGKLTETMEVAVKVLNRLPGWDGQSGFEEYENEVTFLSMIRHRNLVRLVGFAAEDEHRLLVYEYVTNGNLAMHLHGSASVMSWMHRVRVAAGVARGLAYLHHSCVPRIVHRDVKPSNVLLDENCQPKIADFGLAKMVPEGVDEVTTRVQGTQGYVAPEYLQFNKASEKADVFSFGVVLLELVSGKNPNTFNIIEWARTFCVENRQQEMGDEKLNGDFNEKEILCLVQLGLMCTLSDPDQRPFMSEVLKLCHLSTN